MRLRDFLKRDVFGIGNGDAFGLQLGDSAYVPSSELVPPEAAQRSIVVGGRVRNCRCSRLRAFISAARRSKF
jgi:hypothetical protein